MLSHPVSIMPANAVANKVACAIFIVVYFNEFMALFN